METKTKTAATAWNKITEDAIAKALDSKRIIHRMKVGQVVRQGDVYIHRVASTHPRGKGLKSHQLALGNTRGARHIAGHNVEVYEGVQLPPSCKSQTFLGPLVVAKERWDVAHPEHADDELVCGTFQITHQLDARTGARVRD